MKDPVNFSKYPVLENIVTITKDNFYSSIYAITSHELTVTTAELYKTDAATMFPPFASQTLVVASETNSNLDVGLMFKTADITILADYMLGGEGESKPELDDDTKDAVGELASQLLSSLNVPFELETNKKFAIKVDDVTKNKSASLFQSSGYFVVEFYITIADRDMFFQLYFDESLPEYMMSGAQASADSDKAPTLDDSSGINAALAGNQNLELLLDVDIPISVRMGSTKLFLKDILALGPGAVVELEQSADDPIELAVNDKIIARGEVVIVDGYFGFRIKEIVSRAERIRKLKD